jgi:hypothetical protein
MFAVRRAQNLGKPSASTSCLESANPGGLDPDNKAARGWRDRVVVDPFGEEQTATLELENPASIRVV